MRRLTRFSLAFRNFRDTVNAGKERLFPDFADCGMRSYRKLADVQRELRELVFSRRVKGENRLEGERCLAEQLHTGRR